MSRVCFQSGNETHTCIGTLSSQILECKKDIQPLINNKYKMQKWISEGIFHTINMVNPEQGYIIATFNKCRMLPTIQMQIWGVSTLAVVDSGAARSLISSVLAKHIYGDKYEKNVQTKQVCLLKDVNGHIVPTLGEKQIKFDINGHAYEFSFIIYQSSSMEILLGFDFLKTFNLAIFPNLGLVSKELDINNVKQIANQKIPLKIKEHLTLAPGAQQIIDVFIEDEDNLLSLLANKYVLAHSQFLEPELDWEDLTIYFQYISLTPEMNSKILIINHLDYFLTFQQKSIIGHVEVLNSFAEQHEIKNDKFASILLTYVEDMQSVSISPTEDKICIDLPQENNFSKSDISCHSSTKMLTKFSTRTKTHLSQGKELKRCNLEN